MKNGSLIVLLSISMVVSMFFTFFPSEQKASANTFHYDHVPYNQIEGILQSYVKNSNRVSMKVIGKSVEGRDLYAVTVSDPHAKERYGKFQALRKKMIRYPGDAQEFVDKHPDFKVPVMVNGSIQGDEYVGTDAVLRLIKRFAFADDPVTKKILDDTILIFSVVGDPDGRVHGTRSNVNGLDLNRDFLMQTQPETQAVSALIREWNPMVFLDLHGYVNLIEPCTPPHNPNYEYDLFSNWSLDLAETMEKNVVTHKEDYESDYYKNLQKVIIPQRDWDAGWGDYTPVYTMSYAMLNGAWGLTLEAPNNTWDGVAWHENAVMGALKFTIQHKNDMLKDQIEIFRRGVSFMHPGDDENVMPKAYVLPVDKNDPTMTLKAVQHMETNGIEVEKAKKPITVNGKTYDAGTFVVNMNQAKAGLANTMLWDDRDISDVVPEMYDISAWNLPDLWGFKAVAADHFIDDTTKVNLITNQGELIGKGPYHIPNSSVKSIILVNDLLQKGVPVYKGADGSFYVEPQKGHDLRKAVKQSGLHLQTSDIPDSAKSLQNVKVAVFNEGGTKLALERLDFEVTNIDPEQIADGVLEHYDALVFSSSARILSALKDEGKYHEFQQQINQFVSNGGKYVAVGAGASKVTKELGLTQVTIHEGHRAANGIVRVHFNKNAPLASGYEEHDLGFVYNPVWYTDVQNATVAASFEDQDFFKAGFWKNREGAQGQPVIIEENGKDVTLIGVRAGFRDYTDHLFRLFSNALYK